MTRPAQRRHRRERNRARACWSASPSASRPGPRSWFPDAFVFVAIAVVVVALAAMVNGASPRRRQPGVRRRLLEPHHLHDADGVRRDRRLRRRDLAARRQRLIHRLARDSITGPGAVGLVAAVSMLASLLNWGLCLIFGGLLVRALAERARAEDGLPRGRGGGLPGPRRDLGDGPVVVGGAAAGQCREPAQELLPITGVIPFSETIFLWQSVVITAVLLVDLGGHRGLVGARARRARRPRRRWASTSRTTDAIELRAAEAARRVARAHAHPDRAARAARGGLGRRGVRAPETG